MSKYDRIATFIAIVDMNGFAAAARAKGVSTAAISRQFSALEEALGVQLLQRTTRQITLTEMGETYYLKCKKALAEFDAAEIAIVSTQQEATGTLKVMTNRYFAFNYIIPKLTAFTIANPKLKIDLKLAETKPDLTKEDVDIIFGVSIDAAPDVVRRRITTTRYTLCAAPSYLHQYGTPLVPADLIHHHYISHSMRDPINVVHFMDDKQVIVNPILILNDSEAMKACAIEGLGIVNLHDYMVNNEIENGSLLQILTTYNDMQIPVYLYYQKTKFLLPKVRHFIDFFLE